MNVLDELKKKADEKKAAEQREAMTNDLLDQVYQVQILPKMQFIFDHFQEALDYLNFLKEPVQVEDYCLRFPQLGTLEQSQYRINTDGRIGLTDYDHLLQINISFFCEGKGSFEYRIDSAPLIEKEIEFLQSKRLFFDWKYQSPTAGLSGAVFIVQRKIPVLFRIEVDYAHSKVKVSIKNHENLQSFNKTYLPEELDNKFMDELLSYFLRKDKRFIQKPEVKVPVDVKDAIKASVQSNVANYQQQFGNMATEDDHANEKKNPLKSLFSKFKKP